jgi:hypothetical protein
MKIRNFVDVKLQNCNPAFEASFKLGNNEYNKIFEIVNKTNNVFKSANDVLRSIK